MGTDPYEVLGISGDAGPAEIRAAYHRLAALYHPDRNPGFQDAATEKLKHLNEAYGLISASRSQRRGGDSAGPSSGEDNRGQADEAEQSPPRRRDAEPDPDAEELDYRAAIEASLARLRPQSAADGELLVEILLALLPPRSRIAACVPYGDFRSTAPYRSRQESRRFLRLLPTGLGGSLGHERPTGRATRLPPSHFVVCTQQDMLWTTSQLDQPDGVVVEETVTAHSIPFAAILGATARKRGFIDVWIDDGPTLSFRMTPTEAPLLATHIEDAASR